MTRGRWLLLIAVVAFLASLCGVLAARHVFVAERPSETEVHKLLHEQLKLSPEQHSKIEALEKQQRRLSIISITSWARCRRRLFNICLRCAVR